MIRKSLQRIQSFHDAVDFRLVRVGSSVVIVMMVLSIADILMRDLFAEPISFTYELMCLMMTVVVFLPLAYVQSQESNIIITVFLDRFPRRAREILSFIWLVISFFGVIILAWQGVVSSFEALETHEITVGVAEIPTAWSRAVLAFGAVMLCIRMFIQIIGYAQRFVAGVKSE
jgi:TRAP-type C4-dicarboxylate transport system permease small subunit